MLRLAERRDFAEVSRMAREFHSQSPYSCLEFDEGKIWENFKFYLKNKNQMIIILSEQDEKPRGMIIGTVSCPPFSNDIIATELAWWMDEEYRKTRDSLLLFDAYQDWTRRVGAKMCHMALLSSSPDLSKKYERSGYTLSEKTYVKEL